MDKTAEELINYIESSKLLSRSTTNCNGIKVVINSVDSLKELVDLATNIIHIIPMMWFLKILV